MSDCCEDKACAIEALRERQRGTRQGLSIILIGSSLPRHLAVNLEPSRGSYRLGHSAGPVLFWPLSLHYSGRAANIRLVMSLPTSNCRHARSVFAAFLLAAAFALQVGTAVASPPPDTVASASISEGGCCDTKAEPGCGDPVMLESAESCSRHCMQSSGAAPVQERLLASSISVCDAGAYSGKAQFPAHRPVITAAPRAVSSTPLIYHLQRLLN